MGADSTGAFAADPAGARVFTARRIVRSTDVTADGCLRLDAIARYLQDVAEDDLAEAGLDDPYTWVLRRVSIASRGYPAHRQQVQLRTFCSGTGPRWAQRTTTLAGPDGDVIQATAVWAAVGRDGGGPVPLSAQFHRCYGPAAGDRKVSARLTLPRPPPSAAGRRWPLRVTDLDVLGHVNNSVHWAAVHGALDGAGWRPAFAEMEYHRPVLAREHPEVLTISGPGRLSFWLLGSTGRLASARVLAVEPPGLRR